MGERSVGWDWVSCVILGGLGLGLGDWVGKAWLVGWVGGVGRDWGV